MNDIKEAQGLEVVASLHQHFDGRRRVQVPNGVYDQDAGWGAKVEPLCRLSDATAVIDQLRAELAALKAQVPVAEVDKTVPSAEIQWTDHGEEMCLPHGTKLYAAPAQPQSDQDYIHLCAALYQACGAYDMPERVLDALSAAANAQPFIHLVDGILPCMPDQPQNTE